MIDRLNTYNGNCVKKDSLKVYVMCPANDKSGGIDALHQLVFYLNQQSIEANIVYRRNKCDKRPIAILDRYKAYVSDFLVEKDIVDDSKNIIVLTESYTKDRYKFKNAKIYIWWLGINNNLTYTFSKKMFFFLTLPLRMIKHRTYYKKNILSAIEYVLEREVYSFKTEKNTITHLCASYNAYNYVSGRSKNNVILCIEPISIFFLKQYYSQVKYITKENRKNVVLYNPVRGYNDIVDKLSKKLPSVSFIPLQGFNQQQLIELYRTSKIYVDFGAFPGAERIPKEAVLFGCAVITGRQGASNFYGDVPIPDTYKYGQPRSCINEIVKKIQYINDNYKIVYSDFDVYRNTILNLEKEFVKTLKKVFV